MVAIRFKKLHLDVILPSYAHEGDAGMDLHSREDYTLQPGERRSFSLGFQASFPQGYVARVWGKSGLAANQGITVLAGVIDASYRGEYKIVLLNTSQSPHPIKKGDKLAQLAIIPVVRAHVEEVDLLDGTTRGEGGFGSTGR